MTADDIRTVRDALELTPTEFGRLLAVAARTVARWERGEREPEGTAAAALIAIKRATSTAAGVKNVRAKIADALEAGGFALLLEQLLKEGA